MKYSYTGNRFCAKLLTLSAHMLNDLTAEKLAIYRSTAQARQRQKEAESQARRERGWEVARQAAQILRDEFDASKVVVFGSLTREGWYTLTSDIDLAAWELRSEDYFLAVARLQCIDVEYSIDLVDMKHCRPELADEIAQEGVLL